MSKFEKGYTPWNKGLVGYNAGKKHYHWNGGKKISSQGYLLIQTPEHPFCDKQGYVPQHRLVVEKYIGRYLTKKEIIHHINEITTDNRIKNLYLFDNRWQHCVYHRFINNGKRKPITKSNLKEFQVLNDEKNY